MCISRKYKYIYIFIYIYHVCMYLCTHVYICLFCISLRRIELIPCPLGRLIQCFLPCGESSAAQLKTLLKATPYLVKWAWYWHFGSRLWILLPGAIFSVSDFGVIQRPVDSCIRTDGAAGAAGAFHLYVLYFLFFISFNFILFFLFSLRFLFFFVHFTLISFRVLSFLSIFLSF